MEGASLPPAQLSANPKPGLDDYESDQARAKHDNSGYSQTEEAVRGEFFTHGTPPIVPCAQMKRPCPCTVKAFHPLKPISLEVDVSVQHTGEVARDSCNRALLTKPHSCHDWF